MFGGSLGGVWGWMRSDQPRRRCERNNPSLAGSFLPVCCGSPHMRAVWVLDKSFVPLWSRRFPTVEARFRAAHAGLRYELLDEADVAAVVRRCVEAHRPSEALVPLLEPRESHLRPLLFVECALGLVVGLVLLGAESHQRSGMGSTAPEVALALDTLCQLASFLDAQAVAQQQSSGSGFWASIGMAVSAVMPFGLLVRPLHAGAALAGAGARGAEDSQPDADGPDNKSAAGGARVPAWRVHDAAIPNKKSRVLICIEETVESHQYDRAGGGGDAGKLSGRVTLWSDHAGQRADFPSSLFSCARSESPRLCA